VAITLAAAAACGLAVGATVLGGASPRTRTISAQVLHPAVAREARATLQITGERGTLSVSHFPSPPAGRVYEVWLLGSGSSPRPTDALFSVNTHGSGTVAVPGSLRGVREILVTAEPLGGSPAPTRTPILEARTEA
jgi:anti-sigma-K factor RskA